MQSVDVSRSLCSFGDLCLVLVAQILDYVPAFAECRLVNHQFYCAYRVVLGWRFSRSLTADCILHAHEDLIGYKVVRFTDGTDVVTGVGAILALQIPGDRASVYNINGDPGIIAPRDLVPTTKYCTDIARPISLCMIGSSVELVKKALLLYVCGRGRFCSFYDSQFSYEVGREVYEPTAGVGCGGGNCGNGLYFVLDREGLSRYYSRVINTSKGHWCAPLSETQATRNIPWLCDFDGKLLPPPDSCKSTASRSEQVKARRLQISKFVERLQDEEQSLRELGYQVAQLPEIKTPRSLMLHSLSELILK